MEGNKKEKQLTSLIILALVAIFTMQAYWITQTYRVGVEQFDHDVHEAMRMTSMRIRSLDAIKYFRDKLPSSTSVDPLSARFPVGDSATVKSNKGSKSLRFDREADTMGRVHWSGRKEAEVPGVRGWFEQEIVFDAGPQSSAEMESRFYEIDSLVRQMMSEEMNSLLPLEQRFDFEEIDSLIGFELKTQGIKTPYKFALFNDNEISEFRSPDFEPNTETYQRIIFRGDFFSSPTTLAIYFPEKSHYLFWKLGWVFILSLFLIGLVLGVFWRSLVLFQRQKRISHIKNDFINNMTHEFKTPIATINLAIEALNNPMISASEEKRKSYTAVIKQENTRMNNQVEQVLRMAMFDREEMSIKRELIDLRKILDQAVSHLRLQIETREGSLESFINFDKLEIFGDPMHLVSVFINLLDNANKYSPKRPQVTLRAKTTENEVVIDVSDKGMGMGKEEQEMIFERFYRVSTGNLHDVKGHGLGLSYAWEVVTRHGGSLTVVSEPGKGSTFTVKLPLQ